MVDSGQNSGHWSSWPRLIRVSVRIKVVITIVLKSDSRVDPGQGPDHECGWSLTRVNIRIKMIIIIVLKLDSVVDP
jgi:hypothetical protein